MTTIVIVILILLGLFLLFLEFFALPGVTFAGVGGAIFIGVGVFMSYKEFGSVGGNVTLFITLIIGVALIVWSFSSGAWNKLMLKASIDSSVEVKEENEIQIGDNCKAITRLNPVGKVIVNNIIIEARCPNSFIDEKTELEVVKVYKTYIVVKPKK